MVRGRAKDARLPRLQGDKGVLRLFEQALARRTHPLVSWSASQRFSVRPPQSLDYATSKHDHGMPYTLRLPEFSGAACAESHDPGRAA